MYFVRRKGRVKGPLSREKLLTLQQEDRLRMHDEISESEDGPWSRLIDVYQEVFGAESTADAQGEDEFWTEEPPAAKPAKKGIAKGKSAAIANTKSQPGGLFGGKVWPLKVIAAVSGIAGLAGLGLVAWMIWTPLTEAPTDPNEIAAAVNAENPGPIRKPKPRPAVAKQPADGDAAAPAPPADAPSSPASVPPATQPTEEDTTTTQSGPTAGNAAEEPPQDPIEAIKAVLTAYYSAGDWQQRYRLVKQGDETKMLMRKLYEDVDWISVQWSIAKMPGQQDLLTAARSGDPVRIDTITNGNPHSIYVSFVDGRWQIDWLQSLNTLWLSR